MIYDLWKMMSIHNIMNLVTVDRWYIATAMYSTDRKPILNEVIKCVTFKIIIWPSFVRVKSESFGITILKKCAIMFLKVFCIDFLHWYPSHIRRMLTLFNICLLLVCVYTIESSTFLILVKDFYKISCQCAKLKSNLKASYSKNYVSIHH